MEFQWVLASVQVWSKSNICVLRIKTLVLKLVVQLQRFCQSLIKFMTETFKLLKRSKHTIRHKYLKWSGVHAKQLKYFHFTKSKLTTSPYLHACNGNIIIAGSKQLIHLLWQDLNLTRQCMHDTVKIFLVV